MARSRRIRLAPALAILLFAASCGGGGSQATSKATSAPTPTATSPARSSANAAWLTYGGNLARTGADTSSPALGHVLFALDLGSGRVRWRRTVDATGADPRVHQLRSALSLSRGRVYVAYGGLFGDCGNYFGQVVSAPANGPGGALRAFRVPTGRR